MTSVLPGEGVSTSANNSFQLFVKGFPKSWTNEELYKAFEVFGIISSSKLSIDANFNSRGYGFVQFESGESAQKAIQEMHDKQIEDKRLTVCEFVQKIDRHGNLKARVSTNLYVKNFPEKDN